MNKEDLHSIQNEINRAWQALCLDDVEKQINQLELLQATETFWQDQSQAQTVVKKLSMLQKRFQPWNKLRSGVAEIRELSDLNDESLTKEVNEQYQTLQTQLDELKEEIKFSGKYDAFDAILAIHAGAGGTDAQDWAQMLLRMYVRYGEANDITVLTIEQSNGEEAGIKSITLDMSGSYVYGRLKSEHGIHRLVRLSPFNSDNLRQTSFAKVEVMPKIDQPDVVEIDEKDLKIDVYRSGGHGGQSVNTTDSAVRVTHLPTNIVVAIQNERSQLQNKETAMTILRSKLAQLQIEQHAERVGELKGPNVSAEWGNQIRSYVLHPYKMVKDLRTKYETSDVEAVLDGDLKGFISAYLEHTMGS